MLLIGALAVCLPCCLPASCCLFHTHPCLPTHTLAGPRAACCLPSAACSSIRGTSRSWRRYWRCHNPLALWVAAPPPPSTLLATSTSKRKPRSLQQRPNHWRQQQQRQQGKQGEQQASHQRRLFWWTQQQHQRPKGWLPAGLKRKPALRWAAVVRLKWVAPATAAAAGSPPALFSFWIRIKSRRWVNAAQQPATPAAAL